MAYLFEPWMAVHLSQVGPLSHQITAVYGEMLPRQPLRFLLADDPGAGETIMTGLFIKTERENDKPDPRDLTNLASPSRLEYCSAYLEKKR
jgi:hypothetical protein